MADLGGVGLKDLLRDLEWRPAEGLSSTYLRELGIDLSDNRPSVLTTDLAEHADVVVTMGCGDACPYIPGKRYIDWDLPDPSGLPISDVRALREEIDTRVRQLVAELEPSD